VVKQVLQSVATQAPPASAPSPDSDLDNEEEVEIVLDQDKWMPDKHLPANLTEADMRDTVELLSNLIQAETPNWDDYIVTEYADSHSNIHKAVNTVALACLHNVPENRGVPPILIAAPLSIIISLSPRIVSAIPFTPSISFLNLV